MEDVREEPLFVQRAAGLDIAKAEVEVAIRVPAQRHPSRPPPAGDADLRDHPQGADGPGGLAALLGCHQGRHGSHRR